MTRGTKVPGRSCDRGSALVLALLVIATLTGLAVAFSGSARTEVSLAAFSRDALRAEALARAGVEAALQVIAADEDLEVDSLEEDWARFNGSDLGLDLPEEASVSGRIADEAGKLNLNALITSAGEIDETGAEGAKRLFDLLGLEETAHDALLDWLDSDDIQRLDGAEAFVYEGFSPPYPCGNGPLLSPGQVRLIRGLEEADQPAAEGLLPLSEAVTVFSDGRVNLNTAPKEVLQCLDRDLDESLAEAVLSRRLDAPFASVEELKELAGMEEEVFVRIQGLLTVKTALFDIRAEGRWGESVCRIHAVAERHENGVRKIYWKVE